MRSGQRWRLPALVRHKAGRGRPRSGLARSAWPLPGAGFASGAGLSSGARRGWLPRQPDRGSVTAELAVGLPALMLLLLVGLTAVSAVTTKLQCVDAAREAARTVARGEPGSGAGRSTAPDGADVEISVAGGTVTATVRAPVRPLGSRLPSLSVRAAAVAAIEPGIPEPAP